MDAGKRSGAQRVLQRPAKVYSYTCGNQGTHSHPDTDSDPHAHGDPHTDSDPHAHPYAHGDSHAHGNPHAHPHAHTDSEPHAHGNPHAHPHAHTDSDPHAHGNPHTIRNCDFNEYAYRDRYTRSDRDTNSEHHIHSAAD